MKITRYEQSCLVITVGEMVILTDLGSYNPEIPTLERLDAVLVTHEHQDHFDIERLKVLLAQHPGALVVTHTAVGEKLTEHGIAWTAIEPGETVLVDEVPITSYGTEHAIIYGDSSPCRNTGFLINNELYIPGDALHDMPDVSVGILALPTGGPWHKMSEAIDYAKKVNPRIAFPIHDAMYTDHYRQSSIPRWIGTKLEEVGIKFDNLQPGESNLYEV